jgi:hypothetical protein
MSSPQVLSGIHKLYPSLDSGCRFFLSAGASQAGVEHDRVNSHCEFPAFAGNVAIPFLYFA